MRKNWATAVVLIFLVGSLAMLVGCQQSPAPATQTQTAAAPPPPPPPPPPETSQGTLVRVERSEKVMANIMYLTTSGVRSGVEEQKAAKGKTFVVLHFEKKPGAVAAAPKKSGLVELSSSGAGGRLESKGGKSKEMWLTDASGKKYSEGIGVSKKDKAHLAYLVPAECSGLIWHDGDNAYELEPKIAPVKK